MFCGLQNLNKRRRNEAELQKKLEVANMHARFCVEIYRAQLSVGGCFMREHPNSSTLLQLPEIVALAAEANVDSVACSMCAYGMLTEDGS